ncbi:class I SAM-dependent methyltransferase [Mycobacterium sp. 852002-40037_SCH5390672]|uniref:class I SAM-dependent methyltransferase n=1 Tax=Mycobacterium sp. 852002-40037_SCH5390672 TaxID=1834089 RepID=UPI000805B1A6|nr:class I SAM-dependent methyltransferase [Mycobacterium sp. 852002-40037_SCH5390672]OBB91368.1 methyltransferase [Mycobacterium sp. 852002-40037_SCH5390672]
MPVDLSGAPQTMLATFYAKALDADFPKPILGDRYAKEIVERIDYDWKKTTITPRRAPSVTTRSAHFDQWARKFLAAHPRSVVLHLGCGLDSRFFRLQPGPDVQWYDVDYPEVAALRAQLYPSRDHYRVIGASVTDPAWLAEIPADRPALMIGEGLTMYLTEQDGTALLRRVVGRFGSGELQFDAFNWLGIKSQWLNTVVRRSGSTLHWAINGPDDIIEAVPAVRLLAWERWFESYTFAQLPRSSRVLGKVMSQVEAVANMAQYHRYAFGQPDGKP